MTVRNWVEAYLAALPESLRLPPPDSRLGEYARTASDNGWSPSAMADAVTATVARRRPNAPLMFGLGVFRNLAGTAYAPPAPATDDGAASDDWRDTLPLQCGHAEAVAMGLRPNQCWPCRTLAGDPLAIARRAGRRLCECPDCTRRVLPAPAAESAHTAERAALIVELNEIPASVMSEDARESRMADLIRRQLE